MALTAKKVLAASKQFTTETVEGAGAIKGKNCTISNISEITGGHRITFAWTLDNGTAQTQTIDVMDGAKGDDGNGIVTIEKTATVGLVDTYTITFSDGTTFEYEVTNGSSGGGTSDYADLTNKPQINGVTLTGNKTATDLGIVTASMLPVVPTDISAFTNDAGYITASSLPIVGKQNKVLASAMTIGGQSITTVEGSLGALNEVKADEDEVIDTLRDAEVIEGKNLLDPANYSASGTESYGVTYTVNSDGSVKANGTADSSHASGFPLLIGKGSDLQWLNGKKINGCTGGSVSTFSINVVLAQSPWTNYLSQTDDDEVISGIPNDASPIQVLIRVQKSMPVNNKVFYPMISVDGGEYEPYYIPVKDAKLDIEDEQILGAWNFCPNTATTDDNRGVTYTVNSDKTVTATNTATGGNSSFKVYEGVLPKGQYYFSGGVDDDKRLGIRRTSENTWIGDSRGTEVVVTIEENVSYTVFCWVGDTKNANGATYKPMLSIKPNKPYVPYAMANKELTELMEVKSGTITEQSNDYATFQSNWNLYKCGKVVNLFMFIDVAEVTSDNTYITIATLSEKPVKNHPMLLPEWVDRTKAIQVQIPSNGSVQIRPREKGTFILQTTFITK